jgi:phosphoribosyl 1,2-cyclic phosphodiesterase
VRYCLLASGSNGNACFVEAGGTRLLVDLGIGPRVLKWRLEPLGVVPADVTDVLLTHEHVDHVRGLEGLCKVQPELRIHATRSSIRRLPEVARIRVIPLRAGQPLRIGGVDVTPFITSHDVARSVGYRLEADSAVLGYATDLGTFGQRVVDGLAGAQALVVESNHCPERLAAGPYPAQLKQRVAGNRGHLSNQQCRSLLERVVHPGLRHVTLAHLSAENNTPDLALAAMEPLRAAYPDIEWAVGSRKEALDPVILGCPDESITPASATQGQLSLPI